MEGKGKATRVLLTLSGIKIYMVRCHVRREILRGKDKGTWKDETHHVQTFINNLDRAKEIFNAYKNETSHYQYYGKYYRVSVALFEPAILDNGSLQLYPENEKYIAVYNGD